MLWQEASECNQGVERQFPNEKTIFVMYNKLTAAPFIMRRVQGLGLNPYKSGPTLRNKYNLYGNHLF